MRKYQFLFLCVFLAACAGPRYAENINYRHLLEGHLVFGGLTSAADEWSLEQQLIRSAEARDSILRRRKDLDIKPTSWLVERIGQQQLVTLNKELEDKAQLGVATIERLAERLAGVRYIIFGRIVVDNSQKIVAERETIENNEKRRYTEYKIERQVTVATKIYDLTERTLAWSGEVSYSESTENTVPHLPAHSGVGKFVMNVVASSYLIDHYPKPPDLNNMLKRLFLQFGDGLPWE